ncbi:MAG: CDC27 family protein [Verrucomicrobiota bacterium]
MKLDILRERLATDPHNPLFHFSLGQALSQEGAWEEAIDHLQVCCQNRTDWMLPRILMGQALIALERQQEAIPYLEAGLQLAIEQHHDDPAEEARRLLSEAGHTA